MNVGWLTVFWKERQMVRGHLKWTFDGQGPSEMNVGWSIAVWNECTYDPSPIYTPGEIQYINLGTIEITVFGFPLTLRLVFMV